jgi:predicted nucleic acid-binding protein
MNVVVDASVAVEYLLRTDLGLQIEGILADRDLFAPELLDAEVLSVVRREVAAKRLPETRAHEAIEDLRDWGVERLSHRSLLMAAWRFRKNVSGYDALYLAAAEACTAPVLTADGPLSRAPSLGVVIQSVR